MKTLSKIREMCANAWETTPSEMSTSCRKENVVDAKQCETLLLSDVLRLRPSEIEAHFNDMRHRSTYRYRRIAAKNKIDTDNLFKLRFEIIKKHITST